MKASRSLKMSGTSHQTAQHHISEELNPFMNSLPTFFFVALAYQFYHHGVNDPLTP
jgi:hypothetical protein